MNAILFEPWNLGDHGVDRADEGGRLTWRFRPHEYGVVATPLDATLARMVTVGIPHGVTAWEARAEADMLARPLPDLPAWDERAHLKALATSIAPGPPLNLRRRRKNLLTRLLDAIIAALP